MKTKRVVVGTMAAALLSLTVCSIPVTFAASDTVQISVGETTVNPGEEFSVDVSLADIPSAGIAACDFAIQFDSSLITVTSVEAGSMLDVDDPSSSMVPLFETEIKDTGVINLIWTVTDDDSYWLKEDGVFCTIKGTAASDAVEGSVAELKVTAIQRDSYPNSGTTNSSIGIGYFTDTDVVRYSAATSDGSVTIGSKTTQGSSSSGVTVWGDADVDGDVDIDDVVAIVCFVSDSNANPLTDQGKANADVYNNGSGVNALDALSVQKYLVKVIDTLPDGD